MWSRVPALVSGVLLAVAVALPIFGFNPREYARAHGGTTRLSVATGNTGGVYYPYGGGLARIISQSVPQVDATAEVTAATVDNLKLIQQGKTDIGFALADVVDDLVDHRDLLSQVLEDLGYEIATPNEAREMLALKGADQVAF